MSFRRLVTYALALAVGSTLFVGCGGAAQQTAWIPDNVPSAMIRGATLAAEARFPHFTAIPDSQWPKYETRLKGKEAPASAAYGLYASANSGDSPTVVGYPANPGVNGQPICSVPRTYWENDVATDGHGNLIVPGTDESKDPMFGGTITLFIGPSMCGPVLTTIHDKYGQPGDAYAFNVQGLGGGNGRPDGKIVVGNIVDYCQGPGRGCHRSGSRYVSAGSVSACFVFPNGCTHNFTNPALGGYLEGVREGGRLKGCWASGSSHWPTGGPGVLIFFHACRGSGEVARNFNQSNGGGLEIDDKGNLIALDYTKGLMYVYKDCPSHCSAIPHSPFKLNGLSQYGKLTGNGQFVAADYQYGQIDVYDYTDNGSTASLTYHYSFKKGLPGKRILGVAYNAAKD